MRHAPIVAFVLTGAAVAWSAQAWAQDWGRMSTPRDGACFYQTARYRDNYFCVRSGEDLEHLPPNVADNISSIRVFGRVEVIAFGDPGFRGRTERYTSNVEDLRRDGFNNQISSIRVRSRGFGGRPGTGGWDRPNGSVDGGSADAIVRRAYQDILNREPDTAGLRLYRSRIIDDGWSEQQVREALRKSPEYREQNTMTRTKAEEIVRQAYRNVLGRDPDPGSRSYVNRVLREHWSQADVERELRRSPEYRNK